MTALAWLIPIALSLGMLGLTAFLWSLKSGQFDDLDGAAYRILEDDQAPPSDPLEGQLSKGRMEVETNNALLPDRARNAHKRE